MRTKLDAWQAKNTTMISLRIQNSSGIIEALSSAIQEQGKTRHGYIVEAIREKLTREGFLQSKKPHIEA